MSYQNFVENHLNTRIYNLNSVPQIAWFLLADVIISSNRTRVVVARSRIETMVKVKNNKTMSTILSFIPILYLKQQRTILWCFCGLKFEKRF